MEIQAQNDERVILRLSASEIGQWNNALNEVCNGFVVENFQAAIGIPMKGAVALLERMNSASPESPEGFSLDELLALRNAMTTVLAELDAGEYSTRMGSSVDEGREMRNALDSLSSRFRLHKTA